MFKAAIVLAVVLACGMAQEDEANPAPEPYNFAFESLNEDGSSTARQETGDANGRITGFYIIKGLDGQDRRVDYYADETGFHAEVSTSEDGTVSHEADQAIYKSSAGTLDEQIARWAQSGAATRVSSSSSGLNLNRVRVVAPAAAPVRQTVRTQTTSTASSAGVQVTPEGYVLVPAASARAVGLAGREVNVNALSTLGYSTAPSRTTVTRTQSSRSRFAASNNAGGRIATAGGRIATAGGFSTTAVGGLQPVEGTVAEIAN